MTRLCPNKLPIEDVEMETAQLRHIGEVGGNNGWMCYVAKRAVHCIDGYSNNGTLIFVPSVEPSAFIGIEADDQRNDGGLRLRR